MNRLFRIAVFACLIVGLGACNLEDEPRVTGNNGDNNGGSEDAVSDASDAADEDTAADDADDTGNEDAATDDTGNEDAGDDGETTCSPPEERCGNSCVNTNTSVDHCGDCNAACAPPENAEVEGCFDGDCQFLCADGFYDINDNMLADGCESECAPGAQEVCGDGIDNDCDGEADEMDACTCNPPDTRDCGTDIGECSTGTETCQSDGTWGSCQNQTTGTGEVCNELDDDCDGDTDEGVQDTFYFDNDGDGFGDGSNSIQACSAPSGYVTNTLDCNDNNDAIYPNASETCNGADDDCDGLTDEGVETTYYFDDDNDGYGLANDSQDACSASGKYRATQTGDCDDSDSSINPGVSSDGCDNTDNDCDGSIDEDGQSTKYHDGDGDGYGDPNDSISGCLFPADYINDSSDCDDTDDTINPGAIERCFDGGVDADCDGQPACGDSDCDENPCDVPGSNVGYCISGSCVEGGSCSNNFDCNSGLVCNNSCCCPNTTDPCLCPVR